MSARAVMDTLQARGATVTACDDVLRITPRTVIDDVLRAEIRRYKPALIELLTAPNTTARAASLSEAGTIETGTAPAIEIAPGIATASTCRMQKRVALAPASETMRAAITPESLATASRLHQRLRESGVVFLVARRVGCWRLCVEWESMEDSDWQQVLALRAELQKIVAQSPSRSP